MNFKYSQNYLNTGDIIKVTLDKQAKILLLDTINFNKFKSNKKYEYYGGLAKQSPCIIQVPSSKHWYIVVQPLSSTLKYNVEIIKK